MMATSTTMTTTYGASVGAYGADEGLGNEDLKASYSSITTQSKLRAILRDQTRREEQQQYQQQQQQPTSNSTASTSESIAQPSNNVMATSPTSAMQALQGAASRQERLERSRRPSLVSSVSAAVLGSDQSRQRKDSQARRSGTKLSSQLEALSIMTTASPTSASKLAAAESSTSPIQRQKSLRQTQSSHHPHHPPSQHHQQDRDAELTSSPVPGSARLVRSRSTTAGGNLSAGVDLKVVILGAQGVGKTSLVHRYTSGHFSAASVPSTIGASFLTKKLIVDGIKIRLQLWDTAGQERFRSMAPMYYRGANAAVIVYDITNPHSFEDVKTWIDELRSNVQDDLIIHIVGSKLDLARHHRRVDLEDARQAVQTWTTPAAGQAETSKQPVSAPASNSIFGSRRGLTASTSFFQNGGSPPASPPTTTAMQSSPSYPIKLPGLVSRSSRANVDAINDVVDDHSDPSTAAAASLYGGNHLSPDDLRYIEVSEVSAKDNEGIEDVFVGIATRLVERKEELEAREMARKRQERESVFLSADSSPNGLHDRSGGPQASWCCSS